MRKGEMITAAVFMIISLVVIIECFRLGFGWIPEQGPAAGMVPFWLSILMFVSSAFIFYVGYKMEKKEDDNFFINKEGMMEAGRIAATSLLFIRLCNAETNIAGLILTAICNSRNPNPLNSELYT